MKVPFLSAAAAATTAAILLSRPAIASTPARAAPTAKTLNGTYEGRYLAGWDQDVFLGMPYAQPPLGPLRYRRPQPLNASFDGVRSATRYGYSCIQYGQNFELSEDCLTINVVRPAQTTTTTTATTTKELLPVLVWIYGGGLYAGSTADPQYNLSGIVRVGQESGQPVLAVSMNYRLGQWGFLQTPALLAEGSSNAGLRDQRLALRWVRENIAAFGGDPARVVLWGESAGAQSIAYHLFAYGGRGNDDNDDNDDDDGDRGPLFRGAILESGGPTGAQVETLSWYAAAAENLTRTVGCWGGTSADQLACLRRVDGAALFAAHPSVVWNPLLDGELLTGYPSQLMRAGRYARVPILVGANTDEGFAVSGTLETEAQLFDAVFAWRGYALTPPTVRRLLALYPDDPCDAPPYAITNCTRHPTRGAMWRRAAAIGGDLVMVSGRRRMAELYAAAGLPVYSYRFDQRPWDGGEWDGVKHFVNVAFSFQNISGLLGPSPAYDSHARLARAIGRAYIGFVNHLDPNKARADTAVGAQAQAQAQTAEWLPHWPAYDLDSPKNMVLNATENWVEDDTWRKEGIAFMTTPEVAKELLS